MGDSGPIYIVQPELRCCTIENTRPERLEKLQSSIEAQFRYWSLIEKAVAKQIDDFVSQEVTSSVTADQHTGVYTETALLSVQNDIAASVDRGEGR